MKDKIDDILKQYPYIGEDIQKAQAELNRYITLRQEARNPLKAQVLTGMPHSYDVNDQTYNAVERIMDLYQTEINKYATEINELLDQKKWMDKAFTELTEDERRIVYLMYSRHISINKLAYTRRCSRNTIYKILDDAKAKIRRII